MRGRKLILVGLIFVLISVSFISGARLVNEEGEPVSPYRGVSDEPAQNGVYPGVILEDGVEDSREDKELINWKILLVILGAFIILAVIIIFIVIKNRNKLNNKIE